MLKGKTVNLTIMEKEDLPLVKEWVNDVDFMGEYEPISQETKADLEKQYDQLKEGQWKLLTVGRVEKVMNCFLSTVSHFR